MRSMYQHACVSTANAGSREAQSRGTVQCLEAAVRLGRLEEARELLLEGVRLPSPLCKHSFEAETSTSIEWDLIEPRVWRSPWRLLPNRCVPICPLGWARRSVWRQFRQRNESVSESDSFSEGPEEWMDSSGNLWRMKDTEDGICFFGWWCQGSWCEWAVDWDQPIEKCRARVAIPTTRLILALAARGELSTVEITPEGAARLLDAAILLGEADAAAEVLLQFPRTHRTLRFWSFDDFIENRWSGNEVIHQFKHRDVVLAAVVAGAEVSSIHHSNNTVGMYLFELAVATGDRQMAQLMMEKSTRPLRLSSWLSGHYVRWDDYRGQCRLGDAQVATFMAVAGELSDLRLTCISSCTRDSFEVSLLGFAILTGDVQHVEILMSEQRDLYPCTFEAFDVFGACLLGLCPFCGATAECSTCGGPKPRQPGQSGWMFAAADQRRTAAAAGLRRAFQLSYCRAAAMYGMAILQLVRRLPRLSAFLTDVMLTVLAFVSDVPEMSVAPGFAQLDVRSIVAGWEYDGWRKLCTLHRLLA